MLLTPQSRRKPTPEDARHLDSIPETAEKMPRRAVADDPSALRQPFFGAHPAAQPSNTWPCQSQHLFMETLASARCQLPISTTRHLAESDLLYLHVQPDLGSSVAQAKFKYGLTACSSCLPFA